MSKLDFLKNLGLEKQNSGVSTGTEWLTGNGHLTESVSPADGSVIAHVRTANRKDYETVISQAQRIISGMAQNTSTAAWRNRASDWKCGT